MKNRIAAALCAAVLMGTSIPAMAAMPMTVCAATKNYQEPVTDAEGETDENGEILSGVLEWKTSEYKAPDGTKEACAELVGFKGECKHLDLSALTSLDKLPVRVIRWGAFSSCQTLETIKLPDSVRQFGAPVIYKKGVQLTDGTSITMPWLDSVYIDLNLSAKNGPFDGCKHLTSVTLPESLDGIGALAFSGCASLKEIKLPSTVKIVGTQAFSNTSVTDLEIPSSVDVIAPGAFWFLKPETGGIRVTFYNPDCIFYDKAFVKDAITNADDIFLWSDGTAKVGTRMQKGDKELVTIVGYNGSTAQAYAEKYGYHFETIGAAPEQPAAAPGDIDSDGTIDVMDVIAVNKFIIGMKQLTNEQQELADVNGDKNVDATDSLLILKYALEIITEFPKKV